MDDQQLSHPPTAGEDEEVKRRTHHRLELEFGRQAEFDDPKHEWRRLFSELLGTFFLVLVGAGGAVVNATVERGHQPRGGRDRAGAHGHGDHPLHGRRVGRAPEPRGQHRLRRPR